SIEGRLLQHITRDAKATQRRSLAVVVGEALPVRFILADEEVTRRQPTVAYGQLYLSHAHRTFHYVQSDAVVDLAQRGLHLAQEGGSVTSHDGSQLRERHALWQQRQEVLDAWLR